MNRESERRALIRDVQDDKRALEQAFIAGAEWGMVNGADYWRLLKADAKTYAETGESGTIVADL